VAARPRGSTRRCRRSTVRADSGTDLAPDSTAPATLHANGMAATARGAAETDAYKRLHQRGQRER
jgi:hypothetical protein